MAGQLTCACSGGTPPLLSSGGPHRLARSPDLKPDKPYHDLTSSSTCSPLIADSKRTLPPQGVRVGLWHFIQLSQLAHVQECLAKPDMARGSGSGVLVRDSTVLVDKAGPGLLERVHDGDGAAGAD